MTGLNIHIADETVLEDKTKMVAEYMRERMNNTTEHQYWAIKFFFCEVLNLVNVIGQIFFTDYFLGYEFTNYGIEVFLAGDFVQVQNQ